MEATLVTLKQEKDVAAALAEADVLDQLLQDQKLQQTRRLWTLQLFPMT